MTGRLSQREKEGKNASDDVGLTAASLWFALNHTCKTHAD
jgi:hypothetical protein